MKSAENVLLWEHRVGTNPWTPGETPRWQYGRPDRERTDVEGESRCYGGGNSPSGLQCRAALIVPSASALRPRDLGVRTESARAQSFCFKSKRTSVPSGTPRPVRQCRNLFSFAHPPSLFHAVPSGTASASALNDGPSLQVPPPLWSGQSSPVRFTWTWDWLLGISYPIHLIVSSRISFSARPLSDVAASQVPSVAGSGCFTLQPQFRGCDARSPHRFSIVVCVLSWYSAVFHWSLFLLLWSIELGRTHRR